ALMNFNLPDKWVNSLKNCHNAIQTNTILTNYEIIEEIILMGLRLESGISDKLLRQLLNHGFSEVLDIKMVQNFEQQGLMKISNGLDHIMLTNEGKLLHSYITSRILQF